MGRGARSTRGTGARRHLPRSQRAHAGPDPSAQSLGSPRVRPDIHSTVAWRSAWSPVLDAASATSGTTNGAKPRWSLLECPPGRLLRGVVAADPVVEQRCRVVREVPIRPSPCALAAAPRSISSDANASWPRHAASIISVSATGSFRSPRRSRAPPRSLRRLGQISPRQLAAGEELERELQPHQRARARGPPGPGARPARARRRRPIARARQRRSPATR